MTRNSKYNEQYIALAEEVYSISLKFGELVKTARKQRGLTMKDLSDLTGVATGVICELERPGRIRKTPSLYTVIALSRVLDIDLFNEPKSGTTLRDALAQYNLPVEVVDSIICIVERFQK